MIYPFILGMITKVYDDIMDQNIEITQTTKETLQSLIIVFFTLTGHGHFFFTFPCIIVSALNTGFDNAFWKSFLPVSILLSMISLPLGERHLFLKMIATVFAVIGILLVAFVEEILFPEEVSAAKIVFRSALLVIFMVLIALLERNWTFLPNFSIIPLTITCYILLGFLLVSVAHMCYSLWQEYHVTQKIENVFVR